MLSRIEFYDLLDDCHTAISKSDLDTEKYKPLSLRLVEAKQELLKP